MLIRGDARSLPLRSESVDCVVTSPPYFGLRDYGHGDQIGLESSPTRYVINLVKVFGEVYRVLKPGGTVWLNLGDGYAGSNMTGGTNSKENGRRAERMIQTRNTGAVPDGLKSKRPDGNAVARRVRPPESGLVSPLGHHLEQTQSDAGIRHRPADESA
jgi:site-specific DNA-methyltransferase (cytosine-N4-specific)